MRTPPWHRRLLRIGLALITILGTLGSSGQTQEIRDTDRGYHAIALIPGPVKQVWHCWTTEEGMASFFARRSRIEMRCGGAYELYIKPDAPRGQRGTEGCRVLCVVPFEVLAFTWNAPLSIPSLRDAGAKTQVVLRFQKAGPRKTRLRLDHVGFGEGEDWKRYRAYFRAAWPSVLKRLIARFEAQAKGRKTEPNREIAEVRRRLGIMRYAVEILVKRDRHDLAEQVERAMHARELAIARRHDAEAKRIREGAPNRGQLSEILAFSAKLLAAANMPEKAHAVSRLAGLYLEQHRHYLEQHRRSEARRGDQEPEHGRKRGASHRDGMNRMEHTARAIEELRETLARQARAIQELRNELQTLRRRL